MTKESKTKAETPEDETEERLNLGDSIHRIWLAGLGAFATAEEEGTKFFRRLVERGEEMEKKGQDQVDKVRERMKEAKDRAEEEWQRVGKSFDDKVEDALKRLGIPDREEVQALRKRVDDLTKKIDELKKQKAS